MSNEGWIGLGIGFLIDVILFFIAMFLPGEWLEQAAKINGWALVLYTVLMIAVGLVLGLIIGYAIGYFRSGKKGADERYELLEKSSEARDALLDKYMEENRQLQQDLKVANHKLEKKYEENTALAVKLAEYEARYVERRMVEDKYEKGVSAGCGAEEVAE